MAVVGGYPITLKQKDYAKLHYGDNFKLDNLLLLEMDEPMLEEALSHGVDIVGDPKGEAVLCTMTKTYAMKMLETSNTVLLVPPVEEAEGMDTEEAAAPTPSQVAETEDEYLEASSQNRLPGLLTQLEGIKGKDKGRRVVATSRVSGNMELVQVSPDIGKLEALLQQHPFTQAEAMGLEREAATPPALRGLTFDELLSQVQASAHELREGLKQLGAVELEGRWRLVDEAFMRTVLEALLCTAVEQDWDLRRVPVEEAAALMATPAGGSMPAAVVRECVAQCATAPPGADGTAALDETRICVRFARGLFAEAARWRFSDFLPRWRQDVPMGMQPQLEMLRGEALVEQIGPERVVTVFRAAALPRTPAARFAALFKSGSECGGSNSQARSARRRRMRTRPPTATTAGQRARWEWEDLSPYLDGIQAPGQSVEALLLKHTRTTKPDAASAPIYSKR